MSKVVRKTNRKRKGGIDDQECSKTIEFLKKFFKKDIHLLKILYVNGIQYNPNDMLKKIEHIEEYIDALEKSKKLGDMIIIEQDAEKTTPSFVSRHLSSTSSSPSSLSSLSSNSVSNNTYTSHTIREELDTFEEEDSKTKNSTYTDVKNINIKCIKDTDVIHKENCKDHTYKKIDDEIRFDKIKLEELKEKQAIQQKELDKIPFGKIKSIFGYKNKSRQDIVDKIAKIQKEIDKLLNNIKLKINIRRSISHNIQRQIEGGSKKPKAKITKAAKVTKVAKKSKAKKVIKK